MATIPLRAYNREIEGMIDSGHLDEAMAHCRYILQTFPKHIATYRLLGKAYLESQRYGDAADVLQRVLAAIPDDFISHVGMSIIREDEANLDDAIWHMERAFEAQPSNTAIQDEIRRLYGRKEGSEPPKARLTRGALARMYAKGNLYDQAIGELRSALADAPQRADLQALLAQMYFLSGQKVEAVETCSLILKKLPYCLEANRILAAILPETDRAEDTKLYNQRVFALDPYFSMAAPDALTPNDVPDNAVVLEHYVWKGQEPTGGPVQPAWAASLGVAFKEDEGEKLPDWLSGEGEPSLADQPPTPAVPAFPDTAALDWSAMDDEEIIPSISDEKSELIPDWMKEAGWISSSGEAQESPPVFIPDSEEAPVPQSEGDEIVRGEIPDWIREIAPSGVLEPEAPFMESADEETVLPWLEETPPSPSDSVATWLSEVQPEPAPEYEEIKPVEQEAEAEGLPDWLKPLAATGVGITAGALAAKEIEPEEQQPGEEAVETPVEAVPVPGFTPPIEPVKPTEPVEPVEPAESAEEVPDWLKVMMAEESLPAIPVTPPVEVETPVVEPPQEIIAAPPPELPVEEPPSAALTDQEAALAWLEKLAAQQGVSEEELITRPEDRVETPPEWVLESAETEAEFPSTPSQTVIPEAEESVEKAPELPDWLSVTEEAEPEGEKAGLTDWLSAAVVGSTAVRAISEEKEEEAEFNPEEELPDWLKISPDETLEESAGDEVDELPEWLKSMAVEAPEDLTAPTFAPEASAEFVLPEVDAAIPAMPEAGAAQPIADQADQDSALAWLESLAAGQGVSEEELITPPGERSETPPDWIKVAAEAELAEAAIRAESEEEIPAWLQAEEGPAAPGAIPIGEQLPIAEEEISPDFPEVPSAEVPLEVPSDQDAAFAWLESLAMKQGADEEELLTQPEERLESPPEWVALAAEAEISAPEPVEIPTEIETFPLEQVEIPVVLPTLPEAPQEELVVEALVEPSVEMPPHKLDINTASLAELEALPGIGFVLAQNIVAYRETYGPYQSIADLEKISGIGPVLVEELQDQIMVAEVAAVPEAVSEEAQLMQEASTAIGLGDIAPAVQNYSILIKKRYHLPELIDELQAALYRFPVDVDLWQTIGDAYVRSDRLQDALDAYTKAEELIR